MKYSFLVLYKIFFISKFLNNFILKFHIYNFLINLYIYIYIYIYIIFLLIYIYEYQFYKL